MTIFFQHVANGLSIGATYGLLAVGLTLLFGVARIGNFAHGDFFMWGGFGLYVGMATLGLPFPVAALLAITLSTAISVASYLGVFRPVANLFGDTGYTNFVAAIGLGIVLQNLARLIWGATPRSVATPLAFQRIEIWGVSLTGQRILAFGVTLLALLLLDLFIQYSRMGKTIRAVAQNREMAQVVGIDPVKVNIQVFFISGLLAGLAAVLITPIYSVFPTMGFVMTLKALSVVIVGGLGNVRGAVVAALMLGVAEALTAGYIAQEAQDLIAFGILIVVLLIKPTGLFGELGK
jgi:branched-chain amino acid transport system permease protein